MSGFLFLLVLDWVMNSSVQGKNTGIRWKFTSKLEDLEYTDDIHSYPASSMTYKTKQQQ